MGVLFFGSRQPMMKEVVELVSGNLSVDAESVFNHPDVFLFSPEEKKSMGVDVAKSICSIADTAPQVAEKHYIVVDGFDKFTLDAQNVLLKLLEDETACEVYGLCYSENIIGTIRSRMKCRYMSISMEDYLTRCKNESIDNGEILFYITQGDFGMLKQEQDFSELITIFLKVRDCLNSGDYLNLLTILNLVREKDKSSFSTVYTPYISALCRFIGAVLSDLMKRALECSAEEDNYAVLRYNEAISLTENALLRSKGQSFTNYNFFVYIAMLIVM